ncbi:hypothetical protein ACHAPT_012776 [Fusarium lateritium]
MTARGNNINPQFDSQKVKAAIETVLEDRGLSLKTLFNDKVDRAMGTILFPHGPGEQKATDPDPQTAADSKSWIDLRVGAAGIDA